MDLQQLTLRLVSDIAQQMLRKYTTATWLPSGCFVSLALVKPHCGLQRLSPGV